MPGSVLRLISVAAAPPPSSDAPALVLREGPWKSRVWGRRFWRHRSGVLVLFVSVSNKGRDLLSYVELRSCSGVYAHVRRASQVPEITIGIAGAPSPVRVQYTRPQLVAAPPAPVRALGNRRCSSGWKVGARAGALVVAVGPLAARGTGPPPSGSAPPGGFCEGGGRRELAVGVVSVVVVGAAAGVLS